MKSWQSVSRGDEVSVGGGWWSAIVTVIAVWSIEALLIVAAWHTRKKR